MKIIDYYLAEPVYIPISSWLQDRLVKSITPNVDCWHGDTHMLKYKTVEICSECGKSSEYNVKHDCEITWKWQSSKMGYSDQIKEIHEDQYPNEWNETREDAMEELFEQDDEDDDEQAEMWKYDFMLTFKCKHCGKLEQHKQREVIDYDVRYLNNLTIDDEIEIDQIKEIHRQTRGEN